MTPESGRGRVRPWLLEHQAGSFISGWVISEFASALALKNCHARLSHDDQLLAQFDRYVEEVAEVLPTGIADFKLAATFCAHPTTWLRAGDALHLAVCAAHGLTIVTRDRGLAAAATALGMPVTDLDEAA